ncbi:hypothetical protein K1719_019552 [Acacia pycnantha]|nr:hypothetical protein K1719_019552 [Acacia pycnantha]
MASSSSSATSSQSRKKYDVFISFRETYASSTWCLKELAKILECSKNEAHLVMPVFYRVDPSHIRKQSGSYQKAFEQHEHKGINKQQLQNWREALTHAANLSGWHSGVDRNEAELIKEIINCVVKKLDDKYQSEDYLKIGIHRKMADVESLLYKGSDDDVRFIGIWGMGGVGKTTLAQALFNKFHPAYEGSCFFSSVREKSKKYGIAALKKELILKLLGDKESHIGMVDDTIPANAIRRLSRKKVFIVLDDVDDHHEQLENLAGRHRWFGPGSKILVTTRDKQVFAKEVDDIYEVEALNSDEAFQLFSLNAFNKDYGGDPKMRDLAKEVTRYAGGNPLALKVLGSFLYGKSEEAWKDQLEKFQKLPRPEINDIIKLSFEGLDNEEENIFLDIACFFNGCCVSNIVTLLDACGYSTRIGLERLQDKALLDICGVQISMHHLIKEMGRQIVREQSLKDPEKRSRLWDSNEIYKILTENKGGDAIQGIILEVSELLEEICLSPLAFFSMPNLKLLIVRRGFKENKLKFPCGIDFLPNKLKLLSWKEYPSKSLPTTFKAENLVQIKMPYSNLTKLWDGDQNLVNLTEIDLFGSKDLIELPNFSKAVHLEKVDLSSCSKLHSVHPSILSLHSLRCLWLTDCKALTSLTSNTLLKSLEDLDLQGCSRLNKYSVTSESYLYLNLSRTAINDELCSSSGHLNKIGLLCLEKCANVTSLNNWVDLRTLGCLDANYCNKLASNLRSLFNEAHALKILVLTDCHELFEVPKNISLLSSLVELNLSRTNIVTLPLSIKHLSRLKYLELDECQRLRFLPELPPSISCLSVANCQSLKTLHLPHIHNYIYNYDVPEVNFMLTNCIKLDGQSIKAVEIKVLHDINKAICKGIEIEYPGERVPEWFMYRTTQCLVTVDLHSIPEPWDYSFIFCVVFSKTSPDDEWPEEERIYADWFIDGQNACKAKSYYSMSAFMVSNHIALWYDQDSFGEVQRKIEEKKRDAESNTYHPLLQIQFTGEYCSEENELQSIKENDIGIATTNSFYWILKNLENWIRLGIQVIAASSTIIKDL